MGEGELNHVERRKLLQQKVEEEFDMASGEGGVVDHFERRGRREVQQRT